MTSSTKGYLAGIFDGEGSVLLAHGRHGWSHCVQVVNTNQALLYRFVYWFGGHIYEHNNPTRLGTKKVFVWKACSAPALLKFFRALRPQIRVKARKADIIWKRLHKRISYKEAKRRMGQR